LCVVGIINNSKCTYLIVCPLIFCKSGDELSLSPLFSYIASGHTCTVSMPLHPCLSFSNRVGEADEEDGVGLHQPCCCSKLKLFHAWMQKHQSHCAQGPKVCGELRWIIWMLFIKFVPSALFVHHCDGGQRVLTFYCNGLGQGTPIIVATYNCDSQEKECWWVSLVTSPRALGIFLEFAQN